MSNTPMKAATLNASKKEAQPGCTALFGGFFIALL